MASEIMSDPAPTLENDVPESSMGREPQGIIINQCSLSNLLECNIQMLQQISMVQMNPQELAREDSQPTASLLALQPKAVKKFQDCLRHRALPRYPNFDFDRLLAMVNQFPSQLFLETVDDYYSRSALHVAVLGDSRTMIHALLEKLSTLSNSNDSKLAELDFILKDDKFGLSAADMAAVIANEEIFPYFEPSSLHQGDGSISFNPTSPFPSSPTSKDVKIPRTPTSEDEKRNLLEQASPLLDEPAPTSLHEGTGQLSIREWLLENNVDFIYCLHEAAVKVDASQKKALKFVEAICDSGKSFYLEPLLNVRDKLGKSPLHVSNDEIPYDSVPHFKTLFKRLFAHFPTLDLNITDFSGMTPLHWAAAQGYLSVVKYLLKQEKTDLNATYGNFREGRMKKRTNFNDCRVADVTPLHLAVIHNQVGVVKTLLKLPENRRLNVNAICKRNLQIMEDGTPRDKYKLIRGVEVFDGGQETMVSWTPFQLAASMGHERILQVLLKDLRLHDIGIKNEEESVLEGREMLSQFDLPALHLAAVQFHPLAVKALVDSRRVDILVKDKDGNTALHNAANAADGHVQVHASLFDYVTVSHFTSKPPKSRKPSDSDIITCMDMLMQSGLDMERKNKERVAPTLHPSSPEKVQNWWLQKMAKEAQENKNNLISAANAVSVTAALVATASFVGPLQPPLGLLNDGNQTWLDGYSEVQHTSVQVFLFCDGLSFYFAIAAIVFAMLPSWPLPHEGLAQEVRIARRCVQVAVLLLFGSIIFVICAFCAASIAIVPDQRWRYMTIAVISTSLGALICFLILFLSFMRLLTLISSKSYAAQWISKKATEIMLWEPHTPLPNEEPHTHLTKEEPHTHLTNEEVTKSAI